MPWKVLQCVTQALRLCRREFAVVGSVVPREHEIKWRTSPGRVCGFAQVLRPEWYRKVRAWSVDRGEEDWREEVQTAA